MGRKQKRPRRSGKWHKRKPGGCDVTETKERVCQERESGKPWQILPRGQINEDREVVTRGGKSARGRSRGSGYRRFF